MRTSHFFLAALGFAAAAGPLLAQPAQPHVTYFVGANVTGQLTLSTTVNVSQAANPSLASNALERFASPEAAHIAEVADFAKLASPTLANAENFTRRRDLERSNALRSSLLTAHAQSAPVSPTSSFGFMGITHYDERNAYGGNQFSIEPPSQGLAVANGFVVEGVNNAFQVYNTSGQPQLAAVLSTNQVFGLAPSINRTTNVRGVYPTDVRVFYDQTLNRFFVMQRSQDNDIFGDPLSSSHLYIAVSQTGDPTGAYNVYLMNTTNPTHIGCPCVSDYPEIGADQYGIYVTWNEYTSGLQFLDAVALAISKASLASNSATPVAYQFFIPFSTGYEFAIQPATTPPGGAYFLGNGGEEFLVSSSRSSADSNLAVWAMTNTSTLASANPNLLLTQTMIATEFYEAPGTANQPPGPTPLGTSMFEPLESLDGGDPRVQSVEYVGGQIYLTLEHGITDDNGHFVVGGAYMILAPIFRGFPQGNFLVIRQGYFYTNNDHLLRPALAVNAQGQGAIVFTLVGPDYYPSVAFLPISASSTGSTIQIAGVGALPEDGFTGYNDGGLSRWGHFSGALAGSDGLIWMGSEYIPNAPRTPLANWGTYLVNYKPVK